MGRVPAASSSDVTNYVTKAIRHDQDIAAHVGYGSSALLVQDVDSNGLSGSFARSLADNLYDSFDPSPVKRRLYYSSIGPDGLALRNAANAEWDLGPGHVVVMGTGSQWFKLVGFWNMTHPTVAYRWLPNTLASSYRFPVLLGLSCGMNGTDQPVTNAFDYLRSVTEQLLFFSGAGAGASAVIAPSRSTIQYWNALIGKHLLLRRASSAVTWGEVFSQAMEGALNEDPRAQDHVYQYVFEGDPAILTGATSGGGGGCPHLDTRTMGGWVTENSILGRTHDGTMLEHAYRLKSTPEIVDGQIELRIRENEKEYTTLDQVQLVAVDRPASAKAFALGRSIVLGTRVPAYRVTTSGGEDITALVSGGGRFFSGKPGDTLLVRFRSPDEAPSAPEEVKDLVAIESARKEFDNPDPSPRNAPFGASEDERVHKSTGILVERADVAEGWKAMGRHYPRALKDEAVFDPAGSENVRLVFIGHHEVHFVGRVVRSSEEAIVKPLELVRAEHSRLGTLRTAVQRPDGQSALLAPDDNLIMGFATTGPPEGKARDWFLLTRGVYSSGGRGPDRSRQRGRG